MGKAYPQLVGDFVKPPHVLVAPIKLEKQLRTDKIEIDARKSVVPACAVEHTYVAFHRVPHHTHGRVRQQTFESAVNLPECRRMLNHVFVEMQIYADVFARAVQVIFRFGVYPNIFFV